MQGISSLSNITDLYVSAKELGITPAAIALGACGFYAIRKMQETISLLEGQKSLINKISDKLDGVSDHCKKIDAILSTVINLRSDIYLLKDKISLLKPPFKGNAVFGSGSSRHL